MDGHSASLIASNILFDDNSCNPAGNISSAHAPPAGQQDPTDSEIVLNSQDEELSQIRDSESDGDTHVQRSLYTRLKSLFIPKGKLNPLLTPPNSPESYKSSRKFGTSIFQSACENNYSSGKRYISTSSPDSNSAVPISNQVAPLTPESIDLRHGREFPSLSHIIKDFALGERETNDSHLPQERWNDIPQETPSGLEETALDHLRANVDTQATSTLQLGFREFPVDAPLTHDKFIEHGEGVHLIQEEHGCPSSERQTVRWAKSPMPPICWDLLIDDISWPIVPVGECNNSNHAARSVLYTGMESDQDNFYGLQYALELSRRDRRKIMDWSPESVGEYSKSRKSWAILHLNRVTPSQEEYWFRYWLQWHYDLEEKAARRLTRARKEAEFKRYQSVSPWPTSTQRRAARNSRRADEGLHPTLRLVRHRTRSAPGQMQRRLASSKTGPYSDVACTLVL